MKLAKFCVMAVIDGAVHEWRELPGGDCGWFVLSLEELEGLAATVATAKAHALAEASADQDPLPLESSAESGRRAA